MKIGRTALRTIAAAVIPALSALPATASTGPGQTFYERSFVQAAGARCDLFEPRVNQALTAAAWQARGAALRSGAAEIDLAATAARARSRAGTVACSDPQLAVVRRRVESAFSGWARTPRMTFDGWTANRAAYDSPTWRLSQTSVTGASPVAFGFASGGETSTLSAVVSFVGRPRPYAARIVLRDPAKAPRPWLTSGGLAPERVRASLWSTGVSAAAPTLLAKDRKAGERWTFSPVAAAAIERLDPREAFAVEFHFRDGSVATARFTAGDFAAGKAFLAMGPL
jgi:hypothetical protein